MAITKLTDFIKVVNDKWSYGESIFGYDSDVNEDHNIVYPLLLIKPPTSNIDNIYEGWEDYDFEVDFFNTYEKAARDVVELQKRWDNLQDLALEWLDLVLKNYPNKEVMINHETVVIERDKDEMNDKLVKINMVFQIRMFRRCFNPQSIYPSNYSDLVVWLRAKSDVTFDIPTKRANDWKDQSGNNNKVLQTTTAKQPLRYGYDGADDKSYIRFDGTDDVFVSDNNCPITADEFTIYVVSKIDDSTNSDILFGYSRGSVEIRLGTNNDGMLRGSVIDGAGQEIEIEINGADTSKYHIAKLKLKNKRLYLNYYASGVSLSSDVQNPSYDSTQTYDDDEFNIGFIKDGAASNQLKGNIEEVIVFNRELEDVESTDIVEYLSGEYNLGI